MWKNYNICALLVERQNNCTIDVEKPQQFLKKYKIELLLKIYTKNLNVNARTYLHTKSCNSSMYYNM